MKKHLPLVASTVLNLALLAGVVYLLAERPAPPVVAGAAAIQTPFPVATPALSPGGIVAPHIDRTSAAQTPSVPPPFPAASGVPLPDSNPALAAAPPSLPVSASANPSVQPEGEATSASEAGSSPVPSFAPGNFLHFRGVKVAVAENLGSRGATQPSLGVDVSPPDSAGAADPDPSDGTGQQVSSETTGTGRRNGRTSNDGGLSSTQSSRRSTYAPDPSIFSAEDDLFRTKWGWAAFNAARKEADRAAAGQN